MLASRLKYNSMRSQNHLGLLGVSLALLVPITCVYFVALDPIVSVFNGRLPVYVLAGKLLSQPFDMSLARAGLDETSIFKWQVLLTTMTLVSMSYMVVLYGMCNRYSRAVCLVYAAGVIVLDLALMCAASWPSCWLIQYMASMGVNGAVIGSLLYVLFLVVSVLAITVYTLFSPSTFMVNMTKMVKLAWMIFVVVTSCGVMIVAANGARWCGAIYFLKGVDHSRIAQACAEVVRHAQLNNKGDQVLKPDDSQWLELPNDLRVLQRMESIGISKRGVALRKSNSAILSFTQNATNSDVYDLRFNAGPSLYQVRMQGSDEDQME